MLDARFRPLERWPRKRTPSYKQKAAPFTASYANTLDLLEKELGHLGAKNVVIEADFEMKDIRNDGWPRSSARPKTAGVILSFDSKHGALTLPCDSCSGWEDNLRAIAFHLHHLRKSNLYGVAQSGEQYRGWAALPAQGGTGINDARTAAEFIARHGGDDAALQTNVTNILQSLSFTEGIYRHVAKKLHPDRGGETHLFQQLQNAMTLLRKHHGVS